MKIFKILLSIIAFAGTVVGGYYLFKKYFKCGESCSCESCDDFCCFDEDELADEAEEIVEEITREEPSQED